MLVVIEGKYATNTYTAGPLAATPCSVSVQTYPITVGAGGAGAPSSQDKMVVMEQIQFSTIASVVVEEEVKTYNR